MRFNIYHLLIAANESDPCVNIGANSLSGERYRGHAFWDTEVFMLPFFIYTQPETARALLLYRYHTLDGARQNARDGGFRGARYAWESAGTGVETTPKWTWDGAHRIWMGEEEIHVTAAVAYGLMAYLAATGDHALMTDYGAEILFETSRFWASRLEAMPDGRYALSRVVGPDEFHEHVDNSAYTNYLVRWHLQHATYVYADLAVTHPGELASRCNASVKCVAEGSASSASAPSSATSPSSSPTPSAHSSPPRSSSSKNTDRLPGAAQPAPNWQICACCQL